MFNHTQVVNKILFLDIETVSLTRNLDDLDERMQKLWEKKSLKFSKEYDEKTQLNTIYSGKAAIQAEFGRIICISTGYITEENGQYAFKAKSFYGDDEKKLLTEFVEMIDTFFSENIVARKICTHNGKEFDIPYIIRRILINKIKLPKLFDISGKKPWEIQFILDTQDMWQFGDMKAFTSLDLLAAVFGIPTPKDDINGSEVTKVYYEGDGLERIKTYCEKDILTTAKVFLALNQLEML